MLLIAGLVVIAFCQLLTSHLDCKVELSKTANPNAARTLTRLKKVVSFFYVSGIVLVIVGAFTAFSVRAEDYLTYMSFVK